MKIRGLREISTPAGFESRPVPRTRAQVVGELAYLEREKARLERELDLWAANLNRTESRLRSAMDRIALLKRSLDGSPLESDESEGESAKADDGPCEESWRKVTLEY